MKNKKPKIVVTNNTESANGTSLVGYVSTTYDALKEKLGDPIDVRSGDGKVSCKWILESDDGTIMTIYDWKMEETPKWKYKWHIGGKGVGAVHKLGEFLNLPTSSNFWE
jgi:hypothetical protein